MKKNLLLLVLLMFVLMTASVFAESSSGRLELIKGTVIYQLPGQTKWNPLTQRSADLVVGAIIQTKENSQAVLSFEDGCKILIGEMTLFKVQSKEEKDKKTLFTIRLFGKTFVEVKKSGAQNNFKIQTPTALATIRGSKMLVSVGDNLLTRVTAAEGTIEVTSTYLAKGKVLYLDENKITLETEQGLKKILIDDNTIIAERNGSSKIKAGDRIAIYGREAGNEVASLSPIAAAELSYNAGFITGTGADRCTMPQGGSSRFMQQPMNTYQMPSGQLLLVQTVILSPTAQGVPTGTAAPSGMPPLKPAPAPNVPTNVGAASSAPSTTTQSTGQPSGAQASTSVDEPATQTTAQTTTGTGTVTAGAQKPVPLATENVSTQTGTAQFGIQ